MLAVQNLTADANQTQNLVLPDGTIVTLTISYYPQQQGWSITNLTYGTFVLQGLWIVNTPNMLRQWKNLIPFGLACFSTQNREVTQQQDFATNEAQLFVLTSEEVLEYEDYLQGGSP